MTFSMGLTVYNFDNGVLWYRPFWAALNFKVGWYFLSRTTRGGVFGPSKKVSQCSEEGEIWDGGCHSCFIVNSTVSEPNELYWWSCATSSIVSQSFPSPHCTPKMYNVAQPPTNSYLPSRNKPDLESYKDCTLRWNVICTRLWRQFFPDWPFQQLN